MRVSRLLLTNRPAGRGRTRALPARAVLPVEAEWLRPVPADEVHADGQPLLAPVQRHGHGRLPGDVEHRRVRHKSVNLVRESIDPANALMTLPALRAPRILRISIWAGLGWRAPIGSGGIARVGVSRTSCLSKKL